MVYKVTIEAHWNEHFSHLMLTSDVLAGSLYLYTTKISESVQDNL
jgi:hypothetical protein